MVHQWEKGLYEVVADTGGVAIKKIPLIDPRGFNPYEVYSYLGVMREALAVTAKAIQDKLTSLYSKSNQETRTQKRDTDPYSSPLYEEWFVLGIAAVKKGIGGLEKILLIPAQNPA